MITGIPTPQEIRQAGIDYLCLAWDDLISLLDSADSYAKLEAEVDEAGVVEKHWQRATRKLATCGSLVHQGAEFLLKARIADVSPFLLLEGGSSGWTGAAAMADTDFAAFKTVDAQSLPRIHDTVCQQRLTPQFKQVLEAIRQRRNAATHGVARLLAPVAAAMLKEILEIAHNLIGDCSWPALIAADAYDTPAPWSDYYGATELGLLASWKRITDLLSPAECTRFLAFPKKQRRFRCPRCHSGKFPPTPPIPLAYLQPNTPSSTNLRCFVCSIDLPVVRRRCSACPSNVLTDDETCAACDEDNNAERLERRRESDLKLAELLAPGELSD